MKSTFRKIAFALAASFAFAAPQAFADNVTMPVTASVNSPMTVTLVNGLKMGGMTRADGTVTVAASAAGAVSTTGSVTPLGGAKAGYITMQGQGQVAFTITVPTGNINLTNQTNAGQAMTLSAITTNFAGNAGTFQGYTQDLYIGGTVTVSASINTLGNYTGSFPVSIAYN